MAVLNLTDHEIRARAVRVNISLTATDADKEIAPAKTGMIPIIVGGFLNFTGTWTIAFEDEDDTELAGPKTFKEDGIYEIPLGQEMIIGTESKALDLAATRTGGNCEGHLLYIYKPGTSA